jgi:hypothetical protein
MQRSHGKKRINSPTSTPKNITLVFLKTDVTEQRINRHKRRFILLNLPLLTDCIAGINLLHCIRKQNVCSVIETVRVAKALLTYKLHLYHALRSTRTVPPYP